MSNVKLTKNSLRQQQEKLSQLQMYLPTLKLKKSLLQLEVSMVQAEIKKLLDELQIAKELLEKSKTLLVDKFEGNVLHYADIMHVNKNYENIAGVEIPLFQEVVFRSDDYSLLDTPLWFDAILKEVKDAVALREKISVEKEKKRSLEKELREVAIRVNLFEKILIPRTMKNIKKIKIFLGDLELAAVAQAKVAKIKIEKKR